MYFLNVGVKEFNPFTSLDIICSSKLTVALELHSRATVRFSEQLINIFGQLSVHISSPKVVYCLYITNIESNMNSATYEY